jgi:hypothetical protein
MYSRVPRTRSKGFQGGPYFYNQRMSVVTGNFLGMENLQGFEGLSALEESAVRLHEIYKSLLTGGFTEDEALSLIAKMTKPNSE